METTIKIYTLITYTILNSYCIWFVLTHYNINIFNYSFKTYKLNKEVKKLWKTEGRIIATKYYKSKTGINLAICKDKVEEICVGLLTPEMKQNLDN